MVTYKTRAAASFETAAGLNTLVCYENFERKRSFTASKVRFTKHDVIEKA